MTRMQLVGHDLTCPVCGYKYCGSTVPYSDDGHNHSQYESYSRKTTYSTGYITPQTSRGPQVSRTPAQSSTGRTAARPAAGNSKKKNGLLGVIIYLIFIIVAAILSSMD